MIYYISSPWGLFTPLLCFLMSIMLDYGSRQSVLLVILVLGCTGWPGLARLVRGEVLKQRQMQYIQACESLGVPFFRTLFVHLLPNVSGPIFVSFAFDDIFYRMYR